MGSGVWDTCEPGLGGMPKAAALLQPFDLSVVLMSRSRSSDQQRESLDEENQSRHHHYDTDPQARIYRPRNAEPANHKASGEQDSGEYQQWQHVDDLTRRRGRRSLRPGQCAPKPQSTCCAESGPGIFRQSRCTERRSPPQKVPSLRRGCSTACRC